MLEIRIDPYSESPKHRQIAEQIHSLILEGHLEPGYRLPTVRSMAKEIGVSSLTVFHAYKSLQGLGLTEGVVGRGTRVSEQIPLSASIGVLSRSIQRGPLNQFESIGRGSGLRSMATAVPDPDLFHADEFVAEIAACAKDPWSLYFSPNAGAPELLDEIARILESFGLQVGAEELLVTEGSTQALYLAISALTRPGDTILVQQPNRLGLAEQIKGLGRRPVGWIYQEHGLDLESLELALARLRPKLVIVSPTFGGSTGLVWSGEERRSFIKLVDAHDLMIVEDASYGLLSFEERPAAVSALRPNKSVFIGTFSYCLAPGINIGFVKADQKVRDELASHLQLVRQSASLLFQAALARYIRHGDLRRHLARCIPIYRERRNALVRALSLNLPRDATFTHPSGGLSLWVTLPDERPPLVTEALARGLAIAPGRLLSSDPTADRSFRLSYGILPPQGIQEATRALGRLLSS